MDPEPDESLNEATKAMENVSLFDQQLETANTGNESSPLTQYFNTEPTGDPSATAFFDVLATVAQPVVVPSPLPPVENVVLVPRTEESQNLSNYFQSGENTADSLFNFPPTSEDPFSKIINQSEVERRHDAWIPSEATKLVLQGKSTNTTIPPESFQLTKPVIMMDETMADPVNELMKQLSMDVSQIRSKLLTASSVAQDVSGLKQLIDSGYYRSAVNLSSTLIKQLAQASPQHSYESLQIWFARLSLLVKLRQFSFADAEAQAFGELDNPDMFYEFYPEIYGPRKGSIVPFCFRMLLAELPQYLGRPRDAMDKLHHILAVVKQIRDNISQGLDECGKQTEISEENRQAFLDLWNQRELQVVYALTNCAIAHKDYNLAMDLFDELIRKDADNASALLSSKAKVLLQLGDIELAKKCFAEAAAMSKASKQDHISESMDKATLAIAQNNFHEAYNRLYDAQKLDMSNPMILNNMAVCLLYMGKLKDALTLLETAILQNPLLYLHEGIIFNISTLYELESSRSGQKKAKLLSTISQYLGDGFNVSCLKIQN